MKRVLFSLIIILLVGINANARVVSVDVVDAEIDFSTCTEIPRFSWGGSESAFERLSLLDGCLHFHNDEAIIPSSDCQFFPIGSDDAEVGVIYTLHFKVKGSINQNVSILGFGQTADGNFPITTEWVEGTIDFVCTEADGNLLMQCGDYVGDFDIAYLRITHKVYHWDEDWIELLTNGNAETPWTELGLDDVAYDDTDNNYKVCLWTKEKGRNMNAEGGSDPHPAEIIDDGTGNHVFICRATEADTEGGASAWDNQLWIESPRQWKAGEQFQLSFCFKASKEITVNTQVHSQTPSEFLNLLGIGNITFTTEWQTYYKTVTVEDDADGMWSVAFNLNYTDKAPVDFFIDDISWCKMDLDEGFFVSAANTETGFVDYDFDCATEFVYDEGNDIYIATVGTAGNQESWVNEVMISTVRGNDRQFKNNTLKPVSAVDGDPNNWIDYEPVASTRIKLPAEGVWRIYINNNAKTMAFELVESTGFDIPFASIPTNTPIYDLQGRRLQTMQKGISIVGDKKIVVK